jgi:hypothetical protein
MDLQTLREVVAPIIAIVGGLVGLIAGGLSIYYNSTSNRILRKRFRREQEAKEVDARADELKRTAYETAMSESGSTMRMVPLYLKDEIGRKAAWKLCKEGDARIQGSTVIVDVDLLPPMFARDMARRATERTPDPYH